MEKCNQTIAIKVSKELKEKLEKYAEKEQRTLSNMARVMMSEYIKNHPLTPPLSEGEERE